MTSCVRYSATVMDPGPEPVVAPPADLTPDSRRWRMLTALAAGGGIQSARDNYRATLCPSVSNRANCVAHWKEANAMLELGWVGCKGGILRLRSEGRAALQLANRKAAAEARANRYARDWTNGAGRHQHEGAA